MGNIEQRQDIKWLFNSVKQGWNGGSNSSVRQGFWKCIWKLAVPNKIKLLIWRACLEVLPTAVNLFKLRII